MITGLKNLRLDKKYSIHYLSEVTGISHARIQRIESGQVIPRIDCIDKLADALDLEPTKLFEILNKGESFN